MRQMTRCIARLAFLAVFASVAYAGDDSSGQPMSREKVHKMEARVAAIDQATRTVTLRTPKEIMTIVADPAVRNFDKIKVGDTVRVGYYEAIAVEIKKKGSAKGEAAEVSAMYRAPVGAQPAAAVGRSVNATVTVQSINQQTNQVTFKRPDGVVKTLAVESPEGHKFIRTLHSGDEVDVTYTEALAIDVVPEKK
jgi:hypothetical protein